jgi:hypothetical protein
MQHGVGSDSKEAFDADLAFNLKTLKELRSSPEHGKCLTYSCRTEDIDALHGIEDAVAHLPTGSNLFLGAVEGGWDRHRRSSRVLLTVSG